MLWPIAHFVLGLVVQVTQGISVLFYLDVSSVNHGPIGRNSRANLNGYLFVVYAGIALPLGSVSHLKYMWL